MKLETFKVESIDLTSVDPETGLYNTAAVYRINNVDRQLSIGELVMVICLNRAVEQEEAVTSIMSSMNETTYRLEQLSKLEDRLTELRQSTSKIYTAFEKVNLSRSDFEVQYSDGSWSGDGSWDNWLRSVFGLTIPNAHQESDNVWYETPDEVDTTVTTMESKMDELNTFAQQKMIELQSATNKRDQAYDLCSAILKSFNTVLIGSANNM